MKQLTLGLDDKIRYASLVLRVGLAFVFLYAAISALLHPLVWIGYVPNMVAKVVDPKAVLNLMSVIQIGVAAWLIFGKAVRYAGALAVLLLGGIILGNLNNLVITFRDIGLLLAAIAVVLLDL
ncbi:MAG TPA: hypothetical protein VLF91_03040 [Candidatus Saccharimonadales bacterium]|nr:hypothetical protein [Candidatus Saccharimonadales bacterium]